MVGELSGGEVSLYGVVGDVFDDAPEFDFTSDDVIIGLILPKLPRAIFEFVNGFGGEAFPAVEDVGEFDLFSKDDEEMDVVGHNDEVAEVIALVVEM